MAQKCNKEGLTETLAPEKKSQNHPNSIVFGVF
jgi:hypothetical protein